MVHEPLETNMRPSPKNGNQKQFVRRINITTRRSKLLDHDTEYLQGQDWQADDSAQ